MVARLLLGVFEKKCKKATANFVISVGLSAWNKSVPTRRIFMKFDIWVFFEKIFRENSSFITIRRKYPVLHMQTVIQFLSYLTHFFLEWEMFQTDIVEKIKRHILCSVTFSRKSFRLCIRNMGAERKYNSETASFWE